MTREKLVELFNNEQCELCKVVADRIITAYEKEQAGDVVLYNGNLKAEMNFENCRLRGKKGLLIFRPEEKPVADKGLEDIVHETLNKALDGDSGYSLSQCEAVKWACGYILSKYTPATKEKRLKYE